MRLLCGAMLAFVVMAAQPILYAAAPGWRWALPDGVAPPPVPVGHAMTAARVELGRRLFYDADLSANGTMACAACHEQKRGFADGNATRPGVHGDAGRRNVPGLANVGWLSPLTIADPQVTTLEAQIAVPLFGERPVEMGMKGMEQELARRLGADQCYRTMFARAFPQPRGQIDMVSVAAAIAAFERTMTSYDSPHDRYLAGDAAALDPLAQEGARLFAARGCAACHAGRQTTDLDYHALEPTQERDPGLIERTGKAEDAGRFRTPSLRNVALTGPWWHDGTARTMEAALRRHPVPVGDQDMPALLAFLASLTDQTFIANPSLSRPDRACGKRL
ncbi:MAG: cytochrome-c peroxidase [Sphingomonadaceae bacterium]|nr:cytochrome-c peroxidase [Sphingomonadaceae bacterium]